jgi:signal transduction histidine kinase
MRERTDLLQGKFLLHSIPGKGTKITVLAPLKPAAKEEA